MAPTSSPVINGHAYDYVDHAYDVIVVGAGGAGLRATFESVAATGDLVLWQVTLADGRFQGQPGAYGAGIYNRGHLDIGASTLSGHKNSMAVGGAIYNEGTLVIQNSTVSENWSGLNGGAIRPGTPVPLGIGMVALLLTAWFGPGGAGLRNGANRGVRFVVPGRRAQLVVWSVLVLVLISGVVVARDDNHTPDWGPLNGVDLVQQLTLR